MYCYWFCFCFVLLCGFFCFGLVCFGLSCFVLFCLFVCLFVCMYFDLFRSVLVLHNLYDETILWRTMNHGTLKTPRCSTYTPGVVFCHWGGAKVMLSSCDLAGVVFFFLGGGGCCGLFGVTPPENERLESKNHPIEKENHLPNLHFWFQNVHCFGVKNGVMKISCRNKKP